MRLDQFEKKSKKVDLDIKTGKALTELEELTVYPQKILVQVRYIEKIIGKPADEKVIQTAIGNIEKQIKILTNEILKLIQGGN